MMVDPVASGDDVWDVRSPSARRSLLLCGIGALLGLVIAGYGLFTAQGTRIARVPPEDAAIVNNVPVLRADLAQQVTALYGRTLSQATPAQRRKVLDDMLREELYVQRGVEMGLANDDTDVRSALVAGAEAQVAQDAMTAKPAEDELQRWYAAHPARYASEGFMTLHEWLLPPGAVGGAAAAAALRGGAPAASLGLRSSGRVDDGEEFYFAARLHLGDRLFAAASRLSDGDVAAVAMPDGVHILQMVRNRRPIPASLDTARDAVTRDFLADKVERLQRGNERFLRKRADIVIADDLR